MTIAAAKAEYARGANLYFTRGDLDFKLDKNKLNKADFIIVDDLNDGFGKQPMMSDILNHSKKTGAKVLITSNQNSTEIFRRLLFLPDNPYNIPEHIADNLVRLKVDGSSYRQKAA
ncbi:MAG: hypothetical protein MK033_02680 [Candidatus Caenarcaniphilales bacterium]|nr:hypothetical protein [Candidatus Caenarcaniphilales bacterium]